MSFRIDRGQIIPSPSSKPSKGKAVDSLDFQKVLHESIKQKNVVKISAHAQQRMLERDIRLQDSDMNLINQAMNSLEKKGAKESLMIYNDVAFIASVNNRTIITAMQNKEIDVVTNIDSAIVIK